MRVIPQKRTSSLVAKQPLEMIDEEMLQEKSRQSCDEINSQPAPVSDSQNMQGSMQLQ